MSTAYSYRVTEELLQEAVRRLLSAGAPEKIILFGSRATGAEKPDSDLDFLVIDVQGDDRKVHQRYSQALGTLDVPSDLVVVSAAKVAAWNNVRNYFLIKVIREGRVLYHRPTDEIRESVPPNDQADHARVWLRKAGNDLKVAEMLLRSDGPYDVACFHAQQAAERYLKAVIAYRDLDIPRTHELAKLQKQLESIGLNPRLDEGLMKTLSEYAITTRYKDFWPELPEAEQAVEIAKGVRDAALALLPVGIVHP